MNKPKKISIKHYLNTNLKPTKEGFVIYVQIIVNRSIAKKPSQIKTRFQDLETMQNTVSKEIDIETIKIENGIKKELKKNNEFSFKISKKENINRKKSIIRVLKKQLQKHQTELSKLEQYNLF
ncbi:hypothetical protein [Flavobacterium sp.]|uniref:hypothetical protein n=1 Tax=Flavobacterium sp. TaxID=239 RepID=UPI0037500EC7